ncbi:telomerase RNA component interacting RNase isoform X2 [Eulemur rufifrons]|uniref:telomerase RNA component interacting RNase isoform X2 n=1 Tax=Eulemur rufifrons TaxID=859984 RepID=UPI00374257DE
MAARGRRAEPPGREAPGPAGGGGGGSRWAESGPGTSPESGDEEVSGAGSSPVSGAGSSPVSGGVNLFANDGSFLELFKRKMEEEQRQRQEEPPPGPQRPVQSASAAAGPGDPKRKGGPGPTLSFVLTSKGDAWAKYMAEVKKYKAHQCGDDDKTRPLVK